MSFSIPVKAKTWTAVEIELLAFAIIENHSLDDVARCLNRSVMSIKATAKGSSGKKTYDLLIKTITRLNDRKAKGLSYDPSRSLSLVDEPKIVEQEAQPKASSKISKSKKALPSLKKHTSSLVGMFPLSSLIHRIATKSDDDVDEAKKNKPYDYELVAHLFKQGCSASTIALSTRKPVDLVLDTLSEMKLIEFNSESNAFYSTPKLYHELEQS